MSFNLFSKSRWKFLTAVPATVAARPASVGFPPDPRQLVAANTAFAFELMNQVAQAQPNANIFISPFSVSTTLQMVNSGAAGETKSQMQRALKTDSITAGLLNSAFAVLNQQLASRKDITLMLANGLWYQSGFHLKPGFVADNQRFFQGKLAGVDFGSPEAAQTINDWADKHTKGKIQEVVQFPFLPLTRLLLANAVYFKSQWVNEFKKNLTQPRDFQLANGVVKPTPMMTRDGLMSYQETPKFQAIKLPYKGDFQMELYLPQRNSNPKKLLADFAAHGNWQKAVQGFDLHNGSVTLPKFKIGFDVLLNRPLEALGIKQAFANGADFSGVADEPLFISEVKQKSYVEVNEQGTEAAAVTTVGVRGVAKMRPPQDRFTMVLDRPFFFVISDVETGSILFMGILNDPAGS